MTGNIVSAASPGLSRGAAVPASTAVEEQTAFLRLVALGLLAAVLVAATPFIFRSYGDNAYMAATIAIGLIAAAATWTIWRVDSQRAFWFIVTIAILSRVFLLFFYPFLSDDIHRYVWDGMVQADGINPYRYVPANEALVHLRDQTIYPHINRANYATTIYPPVAQMFFLLVTRFGESVNTMRIALLLCEGVSVVMMVLMLRRMAQPATRIVAYAWHPLPIFEIASSGHIDALMVSLVMVGLAVAYAGRPSRGAAAIALGALVKPFAVLALPGIWRAWDWKMLLVVITVVALCYLPYLSVGSGVFGFLTTGYLNEEGLASGSQVWPLAAWRTIFGTVAGDTRVYFAIVLLVLAVLALRSSTREPHDMTTSLADIKWLLITALLLVSPNYPWYFVVLTPFVALSGGLPVWTLSIGALLLQEEVSWDYWVPLLTRKSAIYGVFVLACAFSLWRVYQGRQQTGRDLHATNGKQPV